MAYPMRIGRGILRGPDDPETVWADVAANAKAAPLVGVWHYIQPAAIDLEYDW